MATKCSLTKRVHELEAKYYADGEDAYAMRKELKEKRSGVPYKKQEGKKETKEAESKPANTSTEQKVEKKPKKN
jgi:peptide alpha-N-acetyltransferase